MYIIYHQKSTIQYQRPPKGISTLKKLFNGTLPQPFGTRWRVQVGKHLFRGHTIWVLIRLPSAKDWETGND